MFACLHPLMVPCQVADPPPRRDAPARSWPLARGVWHRKIGITLLKAGVQEGMMSKEDVVEVPLTQGQEAIIDAEDWELVKGHNWQAQYNKKTRSYYAGAYIAVDNGKQQTIRMHRLILNAPKGMMVDHWNHNTLDNRKCNLRLCNNSQNQHNSRMRVDNSTSFKGVKRHGNRWRADISYNKKRFLLGVFDSPEEAYAAYCKAAIKLHGEFANLENTTAYQIEHEPEQRTRSEIAWDGRSRINNTSGYPGVCKHKDRWLAQIKFQWNSFYLGLFDTPEQASLMYEQAAAIRRDLGPEASPTEFRAAIERLRASFSGCVPGQTAMLPAQA